MPHAQGIWLDGVGHVFPVPDMEALLKNIFSHMQTSQVSTDDQAQPDDRTNRLAGENSQSIPTPLRYGALREISEI
jgi:hypothetical protein